MFASSSCGFNGEEDDPMCVQVDYSEQFIGKKNQHCHFLEEFCQPAPQTLTGTWRTQELQNTSKGNQSQLLWDDGVDHWATAAPCNNKSERYRELATELSHASS